MSEAILSFEGASYAEDADHDCGLDEVELALSPGELVLVRVPPDALRVPLADGAQGLVHPRAGRVLFEGRPWPGRSVAELALARARIGRVYEGAEWVSNLDLDENVILPACHHSSRPEEEIVAEAIALAGRFGLSDLPAVRRNRADRLTLRALALVRALLGGPRLLLLERPLRDGADQSLGPALKSCLDEARAAGSAVLWTTSNPSVWQDGSIASTARLQVQGTLLEPAPEPRS